MNLKVVWQMTGYTWAHILFGDTVLLTVTWKFGLPQGHAIELYTILVGTVMQLCPCQNQSPITALSFVGTLCYDIILGYQDNFDFYHIKNLRWSLKAHLSPLPHHYLLICIICRLYLLETRKWLCGWKHLLSKPGRLRPWNLSKGGKKESSSQGCPFTSTGTRTRSQILLYPHPHKYNSKIRLFS